MAARTEVNDITIDVNGKRVPKFRIGADLGDSINRLYVDTNEESQDGGAYEYTVTFTVTSSII